VNYRDEKKQHYTTHNDSGNIINFSIFAYIEREIEVGKLGWVAKIACNILTFLCPLQWYLVYCGITLFSNSF
jgi:hypothetical protein